VSVLQHGILQAKKKEKLGNASPLWATLVDKADGWSSAKIRGHITTGTVDPWREGMRKQQPLDTAQSLVSHASGPIYYSIGSDNRHPSQEEGVERVPPQH
jgi:hypothetical protein